MELQLVDTGMPVVLGLHSGEFICTRHVPSCNRLSTQQASRTGRSWCSWMASFGGLHGQCIATGHHVQLLVPVSPCYRVFCMPLLSQP